MLDVLKTAASRVGGIPRLAERIGVSRQALYQWRRVPADHVAAIAAASGLPEDVLRPDLFGPGQAARSNPAYEDDLAAWATRQASWLRAKAYDSLDTENLAEEIIDLANRDRDEIESRLTVLLTHLLKMRYQPGQWSPSWDGAVLEQRARIARRIARSPSLRSYPAHVLAAEYALARRQAALETGLQVDRFPAECPFAIEDVLDLDFRPSPGDP